MSKGIKMKNIVIILLLMFALGCSNSKKGELVFVEPETGDNFNFPYFLFIPDDVTANNKPYIIVEPNNSGFVDDEFQKHIEKAERTASMDFYLGNYVAISMDYPLIVPVFPRSRTNWELYTHALDKDVMLQTDGPLKRIDLQVIEMFKNAQSILEKRGVVTHNQFLMTGFSASGTFVNRFTALHPETVFAVAAGGLNGLLILPMNSFKDTLVEYPIGIANLPEIANRDFNEELFISTPQFYFMGELDDNDAVPYNDAFDEKERVQIYDLLGEQMMPNRWENCKSIYEKMGINARVTTYKDIGHKHPDKIKEDVVKFFRDVCEQYQ